MVSGFSNTSRLNLLKHEYSQLELQLKQQYQQIEQARQLLNNINQQKGLWERLQRYQWDAINLPYWQQRQQQTQQDLQRLQQADSDAKQAHQRWEAAKNELKQIRLQKGESQKSEVN